jgi:hypothetical protein
VTAVVSRAARADPRLLGAVGDRVLTALPLTLVFIWLCLVFAWQAWGHPTPWLFSDEIEYTQLSRSIAETGEPARRGESSGFLSLYAYVLAPIWWISDISTAYAVAKYLGVLLMTSAVFPAYWLARTLVPRGPALFAAAATGAIPALAYSRLLMTEVLAYPFVTLCFFLMAKALATWRPQWVVPATAAVFVAPGVRRQLIVLWPIFAVAVVIGLWLSEPARRFRRNWGWAEWIPALAVGALVVFAAERFARHEWELWYLATTLPDRLANFATWSSGAFAIGIGLLPVLAGLLVVWRPSDCRLPAYRGFVAVFAAAVPAFVLYTAVKATYVSTVFANVVSERNLIYLAPLFFVGTALFFHRPQVNALLLGAGAIVLAFLVVETPFQLDHYPYADAPGLSVLAEGNRALSLPDATLEDVLLAVVLGSVVLTLAAALVRRGRAVQGALAFVAVLVVGWNLVGENAFGKGINDLSSRLRGAVPEPADWIDRYIGADASVFYLGQGIADPNPVQLTEFWNRSVDFVGSLDRSAPGPGRTLEIVPMTRGGAVSNDPGADYVVTSGTTVDVAGKLILRSGDWRLFRVGRPLRLRSALTGLYPDGWTGAAAGYSRFGSGERGTLEVALSRAGWRGPDKAGRIVVRVGTLVPASRHTISNPCWTGVCVSRDPKIGKLTGVRHWTAHSGRGTVFRFRVETPFHATIRVSPTFSPHEFGFTDLRQLGVQLAVAFRPSR